MTPTEKKLREALETFAEIARNHAGEPDWANSFVKLEFLRRAAEALAAIPSETGGEDDLVKRWRERAQNHHALGEHNDGKNWESAADVIACLQAQLATMKEQRDSARHLIADLYIERDTAQAQLASLRGRAVEECIAIVEEMRDKWGDPTDTLYPQGAWDQSQRILNKLRALVKSPPALHEPEPGTCKCGAAPINKDSLCATCADELTWNAAASEEKEKSDG